jgi:hypothetical protein
MLTEVFRKGAGMEIVRSGDVTVSSVTGGKVTPPEHIISGHALSIINTPWFVKQ